MKRLLTGLCVLLLLLVVIGAGGLLLIDANDFRPQIQVSLGQALGREVTLGKLHVSVWSGSLDADRIRIGDDPAFGRQAFVSAGSLRLGVELWPLLLHRQLHITSLTLQQPTVRLLQDRAGRWNFASFGAAAAASSASAPDESSARPPAFSVDRLRITDGRIDLQRAVGDARSYRKVALSADHVGLGAAFPFSMSAAIAGGGSLQLDGKLGPWAAGNAVLTPVDAHLQVHDLDLVGAGLMTSTDGVGGVLDIDTQISSARGVLGSKGGIDARRLRLVASGTASPQPLRIDYQASYRLLGGTGSIDHGALGSGGAKLAVNGSFDNRGKLIQLDLRLGGRQLPVDDLQPLLPVFGVVLPKDSRLSGGSLGLDLRARGPLDALVISGPVSLDNSRLVGFSLGSKLGGVLSLAGIKAPQDTLIRHAAATLKISPAGIHAEPASADIADLGSLAGKGGMAVDGRLDFSMLVKLDPALSGKGTSGLLGNSGAGRLLGGVLGGASDRGIGVRVGGTASAPSFKVDPTAVAGLLGSGIGAALDEGSSDKSGAQPSGKQDALNNLLQGVLKSRKQH
ncbi:AsmA family protein [Rhodanobacter ginsengiterrae]|uniref:AsmA family protein n=1 Tax=Rhodanobacter ginsengiterrae TaxID=2008451 RepID=UPI003CEFE1C5